MNIGDYLDNDIFKLSTGERINSIELEDLIKEQCHYIKHVYVGTDEKKLMTALIIPDNKLLQNPHYELSPEEGCFCPRSLDELGKCLSGCMKLVNQKLDSDSLKVSSASILNNEIVENNIHSFSSQEVLNKYKAFLHDKFGANVPPENEIYFIINDQ